MGCMCLSSLHAGSLSVHWLEKLMQVWEGPGAFPRYGRPKEQGAPPPLDDP